MAQKECRSQAVSVNNMLDRRRTVAGREVGENMTITELFPHIQEREELKKKGFLLKSGGWQYDSIQQCFFNKGGIRIMAEIVLIHTPSNLAEHFRLIERLTGVVDDRRLV